VITNLENIFYSAVLPLSTIQSGEKNEAPLNTQFFIFFYDTLQDTTSPVHDTVCVQELEDGLAIHVWWNIHSCNIQDGRGQVYVQHDVWVAMETEEGVVI